MRVVVRVVMLSSDEIINLLSLYQSNINKSLVKKAYMLAMEAHGVQKRASGIPYLSHSTEVAKILLDMHFDENMIIAALLHDVVEDTQVTLECIKNEFGKSIASLVSGVTKLNNAEYISGRDKQAENFQKFILSISSDIRILIIKLADRLHNIRTLHAISNKEKRKRIAIETLDIYGPLAEKIGMQNIKEELDDRAFYSLCPGEYNAITTKLEQIRNEDKNFVNNFVQQLTKKLDEHGIKSSISGREKRPYSIWRKLSSHNITLEQINDIIAFRVLVNTVEECYRVLGVVHVTFPILPGRFKDYISIPKLNNYRSLHTTILGPSKQTLEVQIRTHEMHKEAENGIAAHWSYKSGDVVCPDTSKYTALRDLIDTLKDTTRTANEMHEIETYTDCLYCFTPKGKIIALPVDATCVDFAYAIHTSVGDKCIGAKVNGRVMPLNTKLANGDKVEILTSPRQRPNAVWYEFVVTSKAKTGIRKFIKEQRSTEFIKLGRSIVQRSFGMLGLTFRENNIPLSKFKCDSARMFYKKVASMDISLDELKKALSKIPADMQPYEKDICIFGLSQGVSIHPANCCSPHIGDHVVGELARNKGLLVHSIECKNIVDRSSAINLRWEIDEQFCNKSFIARIKIVLLNKPGSLSQVLSVISSHGADVTNLIFETRSHDFYTIEINVEVNDIVQLKDLQSSIGTNPRVRSIRRI